MNLADRLRHIRLERGLTQRRAAQLAQMRFQYLSHLESGRVLNPSLETLLRLAKAYGLGVDELLGRGWLPEAAECPAGLVELRADPEWGSELDDEWSATLLRIGYCGRALRTKREFLQAFLALKQIFG